MASVFLSYDRDDAAKARPIAAAIEKAGHSVWWDKHISGGRQYAKAIEEALESADIVLVLWTASSIESPWVRDEAGAGRDKGRLVPLSLKGTVPPLGFRQFQSVDLGAWSGRGKVPRLKEILAAIEGQAEQPAGPASAASRALTAHPSRRSVSSWALIAAGIGMLFVLIGLLIGRPWERLQSDALTVVAAQAADNSAGSQAMARALGLKLGSLSDVAAGKWRLVASGGDQRADLVFQVRDASSNGQSKSTLTLIHAKDSSVLWSRDFQLPPNSAADLQERLSLTAARVLGCAVEALQPGVKALTEQTVKLYLAGCSQLEEAGGDDAAPVVQALRQVVREAPQFKAGWAKLLLADCSDGAGLQDPANPNRAILQRDLEQARKLDPKMPELAIAQAQLLPRRAYGEVLRLLDEAHARNPDSADVLMYRTDALTRVGRLSDAIADAAQAAQLDPTSPAALANYAYALAYSGRVQAGREKLQQGEKLWIGTAVLRDVDYGFELRFGDPKNLLNTDQFKQSPPAFQLYVRTRIDPSPSNVDRFISMLRQIHERRGVHAGDVTGHAQAYAEFHREDEIYRMISEVPPNEDISLFSDVVFRPWFRRFRQDPRFMTVAKRIGLVDYWQKSGDWPDFCFTDPDQPYDCKKEAAKLSH